MSETCVDLEVRIQCSILSKREAFSNNLVQSLDGQNQRSEMSVARRVRTYPLNLGAVGIVLPDNRTRQVTRAEEYRHHVYRKYNPVWAVRNEADQKRRVWW